MDEFVASAREYNWLRLCEVGAKLFSTCAKRQFFAYVLSPDGRVVGAGYNGSPPGIPHCNEGYCPRLQEGSASGSSYDNCIAVHAEQNALLWSDRTDRQGGTLVVNGPPCWGCGKEIAGSGIRKVIYRRDDNYQDWPRVQDLLESAGVICIGVD